jgi:hypothetical protein
MTTPQTSAAAKASFKLLPRPAQNDFHGSVYYRLRSEALNARAFPNNYQGIRRGSFKVNDFGGSFGGQFSTTSSLSLPALSIGLFGVYEEGYPASTTATIIK